MPAKPKAITMETIETCTRALAEAHAEALAVCRKLDGEIEKAKAKHRASLVACAARLADSEAELHAVLTDGKALFEKRKTRVFHGFKVGHKKRPGKLIIANEADTIALIRKMYSKPRAAQLISITTKEKPMKEKLQELNAKELKKIGAHVTDATRIPFWNPTVTDGAELLDTYLTTGKGAEK